MSGFEISILPNNTMIQTAQKCDVNGDGKIDGDEILVFQKMDVKPEGDLVSDITDRSVNVEYKNGKTQYSICEKKQYATETTTISYNNDGTKEVKYTNPLQVKTTSYNASGIKRKESFVADDGWNLTSIFDNSGNKVYEYGNIGIPLKSTENLF